MTGLEIAVIGMAAVVPGAKNYDEFWINLKNGVESVSFFSEEELEKAGVSTDLLQNPNFVRARGGVLENKEYFDAAFFDYTPREAEIMDPQIRIFHEICWQALEDAGYNPDIYEGSIGIYAGASLNYDWQEMAVLSGKSRQLGRFEALQLAVKDFLCTRVAYKLNLKGPAVAVQTACSTSLTAIHLACRALLMGECDIALAGGISIAFNQNKGYIYQEGMVNSPDGHCRAFDARARGMIGGEGGGVVVLKKLKRALADNDNIYAVVLGSVVNNDGNQKVGFTAPSVESQSRLVRMLFHITKIEPESISYIEAHGTGTVLGDPIEVEALKQAFETDKKDFCRIGSVKTNIGHLDSAAGVVGFIKTVLALENRLIPPSLNFEKPNPKIDFENSPFRVNTQLCEWKNDKYPLRAGVNSLGIGGTNVHLLLEESPKREKSSGSRQWQLILLSAKTGSALNKIGENLINHLKNNPRTNLADMAYTLKVGRKPFKYRGMLACSTIDEVIKGLSRKDDSEIPGLVTDSMAREVIFLFSGQGSQYVNMGLDLYRDEKIFREEMDRCFEILKPLMNGDLKEILYPPNPVAGNNINQTEIAQLVIFIFEYALAKLLMRWGIQPYAMMGHSIGEYVAACLAGVFSLPDALDIVAYRAKLMQQMPTGSMLSVPLPEEELKPLLPPGIDLAAVNGPAYCVVSGPHEAINGLAIKLKEKGCEGSLLHTSHAFHSKLMEPVMEEFEKKVKQIRLNRPSIPFISNVTGDWINVADAMDPAYWAKHLRMTVRFSNGLETLLKRTNTVFVDFSKGKGLSIFVKQQADAMGIENHSPIVVNLVRHPGENIPDHRYLMNKLGELWISGINIDWSEFYRGETRHRIPLPTYPFEDKPYQIDHGAFNSDGRVNTTVNADVPANKSDFYWERKPDIADWFYHLSWTRVPLQWTQGHNPLKKCKWLVFDNKDEFCRLFIDLLKKNGHDVSTVVTGTSFKKLGSDHYMIGPEQESHYDMLVDEVKKAGKPPDRFVHFWNVSPLETNRHEIDLDISQIDKTDFYSSLYLAKAIGKANIMQETALIMVTSHLHQVTGDEVLNPLKAILPGPLKVIPWQYPNIITGNIDIIVPGPGSRQELELVDRLLAECLFMNPSLGTTTIAYRNNLRWEQHPRPIRFETVEEAIPQLKKNGVYWITGALGEIGLALAEYLLVTVKAKLIFTYGGNHAPKEQWEQKIMRLESMGSEAWISTVDMINQEKMAEFILKIEERFGPINGVLYTPGESLEQAHGLQKYIPCLLKDVFTLAKVLEDKQLDFCLLTSSLSTGLGGLMKGIYPVARDFMDAAANYFTQKYRGRWISVHWVDGNFDIKNDQSGTHRIPGKTNRGGWQMTPGQEIETLRRILYYCQDNQVTISAIDLNDMFNHWVKLKSPGETQLEKKAPPHFSSRPRLENPYIKPSTHLEVMITKTLQDFLGFEQVGIDDNFFELGATSLNLIQINQSLVEQLRQDVPVVLWFEYPTVRTLAAFLSLSKDQSRGSEGEKFDRSQILSKGKSKMKQMNVKSGRRSHETD